MSVTKSKLEYVNLAGIYFRWLQSIGKKELNSMVGKTREMVYTNSWLETWGRQH